MTGRDFDEAIQQARAELDAAELSPMADRRIKARLFDGAAEVKAPRGRSLRLGLAFASVAVVLLVVIGAVFVDRTGSQRAGGFQTLSASSDFRHAVDDGGAVHVSSGQAELVEPEQGVTLRVGESAVVAREPDGVRISRGRVELSVRKRPKDQGPLRVRVSGGSIEVFGTRFTVIEHGERGEVQLHEGSIGFRPEDGELVMLEPGQRLEWPLAPPAAVEPDAPGPSGNETGVEQADGERLELSGANAAPRSRVRTLSKSEATVKTDTLLREIASLRTRGRYREATQQLERGLTWKLPHASRELLSYELGAILTWQLRDQAAACAHWDRHQRSFSGKRFAKEISNARATLTCVK